MIILKREIIHDRGGEVGIKNNNIQQTTIKDIPSRAPKSYLKPVIFFLFIFFSHNIFVTIKSTESANEFFFLSNSTNTIFNFAASIFCSRLQNPFQICSDRLIEYMLFIASMMFIGRLEKRGGN